MGRTRRCTAAGRSVHQAGEDRLDPAKTLLVGAFAIRHLPGVRSPLREALGTEVRMRRIGSALVAIGASLALVPAGAGAAYTGHTTRAVTTCTGGSQIVADGNAFFGQSREAQA